MVGCLPLPVSYTFSKLVSIDATEKNSKGNPSTSPLQNFRNWLADKEKAPVRAWKTLCQLVGHGSQHFLQPKSHRWRLFPGTNIFALIVICLVGECFTSSIFLFFNSSSISSGTLHFQSPSCFGSSPSAQTLGKCKKSAETSSESASTCTSLFFIQLIMCFGQEAAIFSRCSILPLGVSEKGPSFLTIPGRVTRTLLHCFFIWVTARSLVPILRLT